jgi:hypothetical protein
MRCQFSHQTNHWCDSRVVGAIVRKAKKNGAKRFKAEEFCLRSLPSHKTIVL